MISNDIELDGAVDIIHGKAVNDPFRVLENSSDPRTRQWLACEKVSFEKYFRKLGPLHSLEHRVRELLDVTSFDQLGRVRQHYFYRKRFKGQQQYSIMCCDSEIDVERVLVSPNDIGIYATVAIHHVSPDGSLLAYEVKIGGEHSKAIHVVNVDSGEQLEDHVAQGFARGFAFRPDNSGYYYCQDPLSAISGTGGYHEIRYHTLGTSDERDEVVFALPKTHFSKLVLRASDRLIGAAYFHEHCGQPAVDFYQTTISDHGSWKCVVQDHIVPFAPFFYRDRLFVQLAGAQQNGEIIEIDLSTGATKKVIIPEWDCTLNHTIIAGGLLYAEYSRGTECIVRVWTLDGVYVDSEPLDTGYSWHILPVYSNEEDEFFLRCESFAAPPSLLICKGDVSDLRVWMQSLQSRGATGCSITPVTYRSKDSTPIEMLLVAATSTTSLQVRPVVMMGYGGFGVSLGPHYSVLVTVLLELGFVLALPGIRGGGEHGKHWANAARGRRRQIAFDDFIAAAEWLCESGVTNPTKLCLFGACNGALLVGAAVVQQPNLFRAAICIAPLMDMVRYQRFDRAFVWSDEYGDVGNVEEFQALYSYSPYHNVNVGVNYPAMLIVSGGKDTRCNPAHALKMVARLKSRPKQQNAILLDYSEERGHSPTLPLDIRISAIAHRIAFFYHELGIPVGK